MSYGTVAAAPVSYSTAAAPMSYGTVAAAPVTYAAAPQVYETIAAPAIVEVPAQRNLLAMGNVISEREITIEELAARDRYAAADTVDIGVISEPMVVAPMVIEPAFVETIAPAPVTYTQPMTYTSQPMTSFPVSYGNVEPVTYTSQPMTSFPASYGNVGTMMPTTMAGTMMPTTMAAMPMTTMPAQYSSIV
jgi:hypothetical protein